ncbi:MAG: molybdopterin-containing oxidoreductase family protein [Burkholderiaceae bacterium]
MSVPLRRVGPKGSGEFEPATWDEAIAAIGGRLKAIAARAPEAILPYSYAGTMGMVQGDGMGQRFFHALGASRLDRTICSSAGIHGVSFTLGGPVGMDVEQFVNARLILIWGSNPITSSVHFWALAQQARRQGAKLVCIDPYRTETADKCDLHIALRPGTDGALAMGLVQQLIAQGLTDEAWIAAHTLGFEALAERAAAWPPERVAAVCGITTDEVIALARDYGTIRPAAIRMNYGMTRTAGAANATRLVAGLPALVGAWRHAAGGVLLSASGHFGVDFNALMRPDLLAGRNPRTINMSTIGDALLTADPPIEALVVWNSNPAVVAPDSEKVLAGLRREDLFTVVLEHFMTDTARYADWVLPATTQLEHFDLHKTYGHRWWVVNEPAIAPVGQALPNSEIFRRLSAHMGMTDASLFETDEEIAASALDIDDPRLPQALRPDEGLLMGGLLASDLSRPDPSPRDRSMPDRSGTGRAHRQRAALAALRTLGYAKCGSLDPEHAPFAQGGFPTPSGKVEFLSRRLQAMGEDPLPDVVLPRESPLTSPGLAERFPLQLVSPPARHFMNSTFVNIDSLQATEGEPAIDLHPEDAAARGLQEGDSVRIFNERGSFLARLRCTGRARTGLALAWGLWWHSLAPGGRSLNTVTSQALTDLGRGPTFYDCLVQVERA